MSIEFFEALIAQLEAEAEQLEEAAEAESLNASLQLSGKAEGLRRAMEIAEACWANKPLPDLES